MVDENRGDGNPSKESDQKSDEKKDMSQPGQWRAPGPDGAPPDDCNPLPSDTSPVSPPLSGLEAAILYIQQCRKMGFDDDSIRKRLVEALYPKDMVDAAFSRA
ncbi:MAG: hypothetical protein AABW68_02570 [archaeon]